MSTIVTRSGKGSPLTHTEVDNNFTNLNTDKLQSGDTAASLVITSADINGGTIDGTTIGASTASTGAFTTLSASSTATLNTLSSSGATITGGSINGTTVGASTASTGAFTTLSATGVATVSAGSVSAPAITTTGDTNTGIFFPAADTIAFTEGGAESMRIDSSGNLGIGTSSPSYKLDVAGQSNLNGIRIGLNGDTINASGNLLAFQGAGSERMRIDSSGNLLVGTTSNIYPSSGRTVINVNGTSQALIGMQTGGTGKAYILHDGTDMSYQNQANGYQAFATNNTERMRIDSSGVLLVACTALPTGGVGGISLSSPATSNGMLLGTTGTGATNMIRFYNPNGNVGAITTSGTTTTYATSSDYRLKEDVAPMTGALDKVAQLKPVTYKWKIDGSDGQGFIAHELQAVVPECVTGEKDAVDEEGNPQYQGIDTSFLVATLTAALQEQQAIINDLKARIETIESK